MKGLDLINWNQFKYTENNPHPGCGLWTDTGGLTHKWVDQEEANHKVKHIDMLIGQHWDINTAPSNLPRNLVYFSENDIRRKPGDKYFTELYEDVIFHYASGGNWDNRKKELHDQNKNNLLIALTGLLYG